MFFTVLACKTSRYPPPLKEQYKRIYYAQFKLTYFRQMLQKSFNNSDAIRSVLRSDNSGFAEAILTETDISFIDSITTAHNELLIVDSIQGKGRAEGAEGKRPLGFIMDKLDSKWFDSLAKRRTKMSGISSSWIME